MPKQCNYCSGQGHTWNECRTGQREQTLQRNTSQNQFNRAFNSSRPKTFSNPSGFSSQNTQNSNRYRTAALNVDNADNTNADHSAQISQVCSEMLTSFKQGMQQMLADNKSALSQTSPTDFPIYTFTTKDIFPCNTLKVSVCSHMDGQWENITLTCKQSLVCELSHHLSPTSRWLTCPIDSCITEPTGVWGVCWHEQTCDELDISHSQNSDISDNLTALTETPTEIITTTFSSASNEMNVQIFKLRKT